MPINLFMMEFTNTDFANLEIKEGTKQKLSGRSTAFDKDNNGLVIVISVLVRRWLSRTIQGVKNKLLKMVLPRQPRIIESGDVFSIPELIEV